MSIDQSETLLSENLEALKELNPEYELMLVEIITAIIARFEEDESYSFIDTKLNLITGEDVEPIEDPALKYKSKSTIYGWIQGRGLESLVSHYKWMDRCTILPVKEREVLKSSLYKMIGIVFEAVEKLRLSNGGHLDFMMSLDGHALTIDENGLCQKEIAENPSFLMSDLFYSKGFLSAASLLGNEEKLEEAIVYFRGILESITNGSFELDQISFDPKNPVNPAPDKFGQGSRMIALGGIAVFLELTGDQEWVEAGKQYIDYIIKNHVNQGQIDGLEMYDFYEFIDADQKPYKAEGQLLSDSGHSLEFVGLATKILKLFDHTEKKYVDRLFDCLHGIVFQNFKNGFNQEIGGIGKTFDLLTRAPINDDMPWWSLPETMRACANLMALYADANGNEVMKAKLIKIVQECSDGFMNNFVNMDVHFMAYQTISSKGKPIDVIPATPDADPGYHTGLSIIDYFASLENVH